MVRYYFHFSEKTDQILDRKGIDLEGPHAAHQHALRLIGKAAAAIAGEAWRGWIIDIADAQGKPVLTVPFVFILHSKGAGERRPQRMLREDEKQIGRWMPLYSERDW